MTSLRKRLVPIVMVIASTFLAMAAAEFALRISTDRPEFRAGTTKTPKAALYGWAPVPGSVDKVADPDTGQVWDVPINSAGWKDVEHAVEKPNGVLRILFVGDSYTYGMVPLEAQYTRVVEGLLRERGVANVEVISMGVGSWGTDQAYEALRLEGLRYRPDLVIYQFCENDIQNNLDPEPGMRVNDANRISLSKPFRYTIDPDGELVRVRLDAKTGAEDEGLTGWLARSEIVRRLKLALGRLDTAPDAPTAKDAGAPDTQGAWWTQVGIDPRGPYSIEGNSSPKQEQGWRLFEALLVAMRDASAEAGARFLVFSESGEEGRRQWNLDRGRLSTDGRTDYVEVNGKAIPVDTKRPLKRLLEIGRRNGIPVIAPAQKYERYANDTHTNVRGNEAMAEDIVAFLVDGNYLQAPTPGQGT